MAGMLWSSGARLAAAGRSARRLLGLPHHHHQAARQLSYEQGAVLGDGGVIYGSQQYKDNKAAMQTCVGPAGAAVGVPLRALAMRWRCHACMHGSS